MPEVADATVEEMSPEEQEQAAEEAVDATADQEVNGFAPRDS